MLKLKDYIDSKDKKYINAILKLPSFTILDEDFDNNKDELSQSEMNEINNDLKQRWLK
tara:strand:+ start:522 stop:695 length:174 start_codon:yes stop_codon:yes gene_type:complete